MSDLFDRRRRLNLMADAVLTALAYYGAFLVRFDAIIPSHYERPILYTLPLVIAVHIVTGYSFRLYDIVWRYVSMWDMLRIATATFAGSLALFLIPSTISIHLPYSTHPLTFLLLVMFRSGIRAARRAVHELRSVEQGKRILVYGAGDAGALIVRDMKFNDYYGYTPIGFIDDDPVKLGRRIHGIPVLGCGTELPRLMERVQPEEVLIAMPRASSATIRRILQQLQDYHLPVKVLPSIRDLINGAVSVAAIRDISLPVLLARPRVGLESGMVRNLIEGGNVMVTGAGGSIGSELCRQILGYNPARLVIYERHENSLYTIEKELLEREGGKAIVPALGDVCDRNRVDQTISSNGVQMIFHAAAHKHVPLMELNPGEAVKNNVRGTRVLLESALAHGIERFLLVSTDKAVHPTNLMGASKRAAEMLVQVAARQSDRSFGVVRFGNVLGSSGSVVPRFLEQIKRGGPVTITHPEVRRYFMLIPEAVQLILHAAPLSQPGRIYVLEMGEQIKILDMACHLIRLAGYVPYEDIEIQFVGLRPGEKLFEELIAADEISTPSPVNGVMVVDGTMALNADWLAAQVKSLEQAAETGDTAGLIKLMTLLVPTFTPDISSYAQRRPEDPFVENGTSAIPLAKSSAA